MGARTVSANRVAKIPGSIPPRPGRRIVIVGSTGAGKTRLARRLSQILDIPHFELDELNWAPGWTMVVREEFRRRATAAVAADCWIADGNYSSVRDIVWGRPDSIVWLDYGLFRVWWRLFRRTSYRLLFRQRLWHGNRETLNNFFRKDNLFLWAVHHRRHTRPNYLRLFASEELSQLSLIHLRSPRQTKLWLASLTRDT
jgi:adenylate kinase family enzyme